MAKTRIYLDNCVYNRPFDDQLKEPFDYTEWQQNLYKDVSLDDFYRNVLDYKQKKLNR